jgi:predicted signal transduction protein with EAL and GGDEF domain
VDTESIAYIIEVLAGLVQLAAAALALSLIRLSGKQVAWILLTCGLTLQVWRRFYRLLHSSSLDLQESITALLVSALLLVGVIGIRRVFVALADTRSQLEHLARSDPLTDLPNRASFLKALEREISRVQRGATAVVLFADIDEFKACNDARGHAFGDVVLCDIASAFREVVR